MEISVLWFRQDLRISDNIALLEAVKSGRVMPVYILDEVTLSEFKMGRSARWWLHQSLIKLNKSLDGKLNLYVGRSKDILLKIAANHAVSAVYWNKCYEPWRLQNDAEIAQQLAVMDIKCESFNSSLLWQPQDIAKDDGTSYKVFTHFYRKCLQKASPRYAMQAPSEMVLVKDEHNQCKLEDLNLLPESDYGKALDGVWEVGESAAQNKLNDFLDNHFLGYKVNRDYPCKSGCSRLSPHLHFGEISPHQIWHAAKTKALINEWAEDLDCFAKEVCWREFSYYLLYHFPQLPRENFQAKFDDFPWQNDEGLLQAWKAGQTGYPLVDAGMRELQQTGYMHNRVRMIVASFLTKNLLLDWRLGADWFWDYLVDADLASNSASWQWVAGSGADAAPYFRIFNPTTQGKKFDQDGEYIRKFAPELRQLPDKYLFEPWEAPAQILKAAGVVLGKDYPHPIVSITNSRAMALNAYRMIST